MTDIICKCGHEAGRHTNFHGHCGVCGCTNTEADVYRAHIAKLEAENAALIKANLEVAYLNVDLIIQLEQCKNEAA